MNLGGRSLKPAEQAGILVALMVMGLYGYMNFIYPSPSRKMQRVERKYVETAGAVEKLRRDKASGSTDRVIRMLRKDMASAEKTLREVENILASGPEKDVIPTRIIQIAAEKGLMIQDYSQITDKNRIMEICGNQDHYELSYYSMTLRGRFELVMEFLKVLQTFPKLIALRKITVDMPVDGSMLQTKIWFSI